MAGTNKQNKIIFTEPIIILKSPQLAENIGMVARTMVNFGLRNLRIVNPKVDWPNKKSYSVSAGAFDIIEKYTTVYENLEEAIKDIQYLCATTVRIRDLDCSYTSPKIAVRNIRKNHWNKKIGFLFGGEKAGLDNNDISEANLLITIPSSKAFGSLNLGMAVNVIGYEWYTQKIKQKQLMPNKIVANKKKVNYFKSRILKELHYIGFFKDPKNDTRLVINVKNIISKSNLSEKELKILHGIVTSLKNFKINN